ncbi:unnamed protein product [Mytilus edulis]|uniref:Retrotransposon gag domain-containing protein n=1 Tax=Mytilus edulis TaxID=6550 RepID=A0A8S3PTQ8_MYTED|nr:unnamed protein product [Mytilus edulis]
MSAVSQIPSSTAVSQFNTNHQNKPHIHPIKPFDGNSSVVQWFKSFMIYMNIMNCTEQTIVQSFSHFLTGKAEQWFLTLNEQVVTLNRLQELLYTRFKPTPLTVEMLQVEQGNSESVDDYIHRVMKMCADANLQEIQLMTKAMRGLKATIARIVMPQSPINIEDLRIKANLAETTLRVTSKEQDSDFHASVSYITEHLDSKLEQIRLENDAVIAAVSGNNGQQHRPYQQQQRSNYQQQNSYRQQRPYQQRQQNQYPQQQNQYHNSRTSTHNSRTSTHNNKSQYPQQEQSQYPQQRNQQQRPYMNNQECHRCGKSCGSPKTCYAKFKICNHCKLPGHIYNACWNKNKPRVF